MERRTCTPSIPTSGPDELCRLLSSLRAARFKELRVRLYFFGGEEYDGPAATHPDDPRAAVLPVLDGEGWSEHKPYFAIEAREHDSPAWDDEQADRRKNRTVLKALGLWDPEGD